jgi:hypothetical protein
VDWQICIAHILTKAKEISTEHALLPQAEKEAAVGPFCNRLIDLGSQLCNVEKKLKSGDIPWKDAAKIEKSSITELNPAKRGTNKRFVSNLPRLSGAISSDPSRNSSLLFSGTPAYRLQTITRNKLSGSW